MSAAAVAILCAIALAPRGAGAADAGTPDAGTPDAGTPDAGTADAGTADAGTAAATPDAGELPWLIVSQLRVPQVLITDVELRDAALNCSAAINSAIDAQHQCKDYNVVIKAVEASTAAGAIASTAMASQVGSGAKQHWLWAGIGFAAVFGLTSKFDDWLKCDERTFAQDLLSHERMTHLLNAAHLAGCAEDAPPVEDAGTERGDINTTSRADGGMDATNFMPSAELCEELVTAADGGTIRRMPSKRRLRDRAHQELIACFSMRATRYGVFTASPSAAGSQ